jgi:hypothetical protein
MNNNLKINVSELIEKRANIVNDGNGHVKIGCVVLQKNSQYLLRDWLQ